MSSELIDSIIDVAAISKEFKEIDANVEKFKADIKAMADDIKKIMDFSRGAKNVEDLTTASKKLNDATVDSEKVTKAYQTELEKLKQKTEQLTGAEKAANIEIAKARLELASAQKEVKAAAVAEIEAAAATGKLSDSYNDLDRELKAAKMAYRAMTSEEKKASGDELLSKIQKLDKELKDADVSMGQFNRNVGNYPDIADKAAGASVDMAGGMDMMTKGAASTAKGLWGTVKAALAFIATPLGAVLTVIAGTVAVLVKAFSRSEESMGKLKTVTGALSGVFGGLMNSLKPVVEFIANGAVKAFEGLGNVAEKTMGLVSKGLKYLGFDKAAESVDKFTASTKESAKEGAKLAAMQAEQTKNERELTRIRFEYLKEQEKFRQIRDDVSKSTAERMKANDALGASLMKQGSIEMNILKQALVIANERVKIDGATSENLDKVAEAKANIADMEERINGFQSEQLVNAVGLKKEAADAAKAQSQAITDAQRRLTDAKLAAMSEGEEKQIAISKENLKRQIEDLTTNGQLTAELKKSLEETNQKDLQKIRDDFAKQKKDKDQADVEKMVAEFEKGLAKQTEALSADYRQRESDLKKQYANGKISKEEYEKQLVAIQSEAVRQANDVTIKAIQKELEIANISEDKRAELSAKLRDLQIENENAVADATIKANEDKKNSDKSALDERIRIAGEISSASMELFGAVADYQKQQSDQRLEELAAEQTASDDYFAKRQENLDNAIMSDEKRDMIQKKLNDDKAKRDKAIADKQQAEKVRQAKWEKAQGLIGAIVSTSLATVNALAASPWSPLNFVFAGLAAAAGAVQIASIASQKIPAYEKGGVTGEGLALWGERRPEVAVTPTGDVLFAEKPTISNFDAGTRIFKSVEDYEKNISMSNGGKNFEFDYEKMASVMPQTTVNLDSNGLWSVMNGQQSRAVMINRRLKLGNN